MMRDRVVQLVALGVLVATMLGAGSLLGPILKRADDAQLRYTDVSVEGAPPIVALGTAIGALRGLIVDYLWIKVNMMKEKGLFYEVMADADLITKLQPRFGQVWAFHGHNMAYNISVMTDTPEERWNWVNAGINLVRNSGIRHNPNDMVLHKELAFWFAHKIDNVSDDAHLHYKRELAREWHLLLGPPPFDQEQRLAWIKRIADAPDTLAQLIEEHPEVGALVEKLTNGLQGFGKEHQFSLTGKFLKNIGMWMSSQVSTYARALGLPDRFRANDPIYATLDQVLGNPENAPAARELLTFMRKKVLLEEYNMDPQLMYEFASETGPLDWRHPQAHALYWSMRGQRFGEDRQDEDTVYTIINNDRLVIQAMQGLSRSGLMSVDPFSNDNPGRLSDVRWIHVLDDYFAELYDKHYESRGAGADTFTHQHENFMRDAVVSLFRLGDMEGATKILERLDSLYGKGGAVPNLKYVGPLDVFVQEETYDNYIDRPWRAHADVQFALERGFKEGLLLSRPEVLNDALTFARDLIQYFKDSEVFDYTNKMGEERMADLVPSLRKSVEEVFLKVLSDPSMSMFDRLTIYNRADIAQKRLVYDAALEPLRMEFERSPLSSTLEFASAFPEPEGMQEWREERAAADAILKQEREDRSGAERQ